MSKSFICYDGCPFILDASCVEYNGPDLDNLFNIGTGARLDVILQSIDALSFDETLFSANNTNSIYAIAGGVKGHSPQYNVRINSSVDNLITLTENGLRVSLTSGGDGKVKVDADDDKAYLEDQFGTGDDGIVILAVIPVKTVGKMEFVPELDVEALLDEIHDNYIEQFCEIIHDCIPHQINLFITSTTTTTTIP